MNRNEHENIVAGAHKDETHSIAEKCYPGLEKIFFKNIAALTTDHG